ncbi:hypothetical protein P154DRAFT_521866 [Amniculicola lignicola CBS 123094]|uniref:Uncharacterized protein n=1 Tax=Amniculicola lignicola CBS 123094 TaxID=1392246 RepID=A0A6A5WJE2_9PLEO|nr:hypothetical protein P154DRAFT_521866 [Amniculicola lignicola CBS 123094]
MHRNAKATTKSTHDTHHLPPPNPFAGNLIRIAGHPLKCNIASPSPLRTPHSAPPLMLQPDQPTKPSCFSHRGKSKRRDPPWRRAQGPGMTGETMCGDVSGFGAEGAR